MTKLHPHLQELVDALRSGDYKQGKHVLCDSEGRHCCLGVACRIALGEPDVVSELGCCIWGHAEATAPRKVVEYFGLHRRAGRLEGERLNGSRNLTDANDGGATFSEIADFIEAHPEAVSTLRAEA